MSSKYFVLIPCAVAFAGCGTLFHSPPRLQVLGPAGIEVDNMNGQRLPAYSSEDEHGVYLDRHTDSVRILYRDKEAIVGVKRHLWSAEVLNLLTLGVGNVVDDMTDSWFNYAPVLVTVDSSRVHGLQGISATTSNMIGETHDDRALKFLFFGGPSFTLQMDGAFPSSGGKFPSAQIAFQAGAGIDLFRKFEAFYETRFEPSYPLSSEVHSETAEITASDFGARYFLTPHYFVQGAIGEANASGFYINDYYYYDYYNYYPTQRPPSTNSFTEAGVGLGWAGDVSFVSLQYFQGLSNFALIGYSGIQYHTIYLNIGLNLRL